MKKFLAMLLALAMVFALCACGAETAAPAQSPAAEEPASTATEAPAESAETDEFTWRDYDLSGEITIYTTQSENQISIIEDAFAEAYPDVTLNFVNDNTGTLITRLDAEQGNVVADAFFGALGQMDGTKYHQYFDTYDNIYVDECFMKDPYGIYNYFTIAVNVIMTNPDVLAELGVEVNSWADLFQPELKGMVGNMNPNTSSSSYRNLVAWLYGAGNGDPMGDDAWAFAADMMSAMDGQYGTNLPTAVANGEWAAAVFYEDSALANQHDGMNIVTVYPDDYNLACFIGCAVVKGAPNLDGAHAVVDYICSAEYQTKLMEETQAFRPANSTVTYEIEGMPAYDDLPLVDWEPAYVIEHNQDIYDKWNAIWEEKGFN